MAKMKLGLIWRHFMRS